MAGVDLVKDTGGEMEVFTPNVNSPLTSPISVLFPPLRCKK